MFRKTLLGLALVAAFAPGLASAQSALATEGPWLVRVRATYMSNDNSNDPTLALGQVEAKSRWIPEFDVSYFFTDNIAAELVLTWPQTIDVTLGGKDIGSLKALPPTLLLQYHFIPDGAIRPYVGAGVNFTSFSSRDFSIKGLTTSSSSWGPALQVGVDYKIAPRWYLNADVKYVWMNTDVSLNGAKLTTVDINPWLLSLGVGYRF
jgi:outer membrane protein